MRRTRFLVAGLVTLLVVATQQPHSPLNIAEQLRTPTASAASIYYVAPPKVECRPFRNSPTTTVPAGTAIGDPDQVKFLIESGQVAYQIFQAGQAHPTIRFINIYNASSCHIAPVFYGLFYKVFDPEGSPNRYNGQELQYQDGPVGVPAGAGVQFAFDGPPCALQIDLYMGSTTAPAFGAGVIENHMPLCQHPAPPPPPPPAPTPQCRDGIDNDGDGAVDMNDFSCSSPDDNDETNPKAQCQDGIDNDGDGLVDFPQDPGCQSRQDNDETNAASSSSSVSSSATSSSSSTSSAPVPQCRDGIDNDGDGVADFNDPGCYTGGVYNPNDNDETNTVQSSSSSMSSMSSSSVSSARAQCADGIDNDGDGVSDFNDPGCYTGGTYNPNDNDERNQCSDGIDNDGDGVSDFNDPGCYTNGNYNPQDNDETNAASSSSSSVSSASSSAAHAQCSDGIDNDGDGATDFNDPGCYTGGTYNPNDNDERNQCSDGIDNDGDGLADFNDPGCYTNGNYNPQDNDEFNAASSSSSSVSSVMSSSSSSVNQPQCSDGVDNDHDGKIDIYDPGCYNGGYYTPWDNDETDAAASSSSSSVMSSSSSSVYHAQCSDGVDNDHDGKIDIYDPGCYNNGYYDPNDNDEYNAAASSSSSVSSSMSSSSSSSVSHPQCSDGADNDHDGRIDAQDPGCYNNGYYTPWDNDETDPVASSSSSSVSSVMSSSSSSANQPQCSDGVDNDHDGRVDIYDPGCYMNGYYNPWDNDETDPAASSSSSVMSSSSSSVYRAACSDGMDNDNDGRVDFNDPGCYTNGIYNPNDTDELDAASSSSSSVSSSSSSVYRAQCSDGVDNDNDGRTDIYDPGCYNGGYYDPNDNSEQDNISSSSSSSSSQQNQQVNLQVTVNGPSSVSVGDTITYNVLVLNTGNTSATNTILNVSISGGLTFLGGSNCQTVNGGLTCNLGTLGAGQTQNLSLSFRVEGNQCTPGSIMAVFLVHSDQGDSSPADNTYTSTIALQCPNAVLTLQKTDNRSTANPGETLTYTITVQNHSATQATNVQVTDMLPNQLQSVSASDGGSVNGQTVTWNNLTVPAYGQKTLTVQAQVAPNCQAGVLVNSARITSGGIVDAGASDATLILAQQNAWNGGNNGGSNGGYYGPYQQSAQQGPVQLQNQNTITLTGAAPVSSNTTIVLPPYNQPQPAFQPISQVVAVDASSDSKTPDYADTELRTITMLPKTGADGHTGPLENVSKYLLPASSSGNAAASATVWGSLLLMGLGVAGKVARRMI
jgi:uncharacterized repeat protein (TIGR01451 family)